MNLLPALPLVSRDFPSLLLDHSPTPSLPVFPAPAKRVAARPAKPSLPEYNRLRHEPAATRRKPLPAVPAADYTDADLLDALLPLFLSVPVKAPLPDATGLESVIRSSFRRALSEHSGSPFRDPDLFHRSVWRLQALLSSRSYEDVLSEKLSRFHVEEVFLLDRRKLSLISFASRDPVRHSNARKADPLARQLAGLVRDSSGRLVVAGKLPDGMGFFVREGQMTMLAAVVRGEADELVKADLDFALKRIESRFSGPLARGNPLLRELQPLLEDCLMIHSPAASAGR